jgi:hypothetical protein
LIISSLYQLLVSDTRSRVFAQSPCFITRQNQHKKEPTWVYLMASCYAVNYHAWIRYKWQFLSASDPLSGTHLTVVRSSVSVQERNGSHLLSSPHSPASTTVTNTWPHATPAPQQQSNEWWLLFWHKIAWS